jgi:hypothetical protein
MDALSHLQTPLRSLVSTDGNLPYDTLLEFHYHAPASSSSWSCMHDSPLKSDFPISLEVTPQLSGALQLKVTFKDTHTIASEARMMLQQLDDVMLHILSNPESNIRDCFSGVRSELSGSGNRKPVENNPVPFLHSQFENWARDHPDDIALVYKSDLKDARYLSSPILTTTY